MLLKVAGLTTLTLFTLRRAFITMLKRTSTKDDTLIYLLFCTVVMYLMFMGVI